MRRDRLVRQLAVGWVLAPILGWWPNTWMVVAQGWWGALASVAVILVAPHVLVQAHCATPLWWLAAACAPALGWLLRFPGSADWMVTASLWVMALWLLLERVGWPSLRHGVLLAAWLVAGWWVGHCWLGWDAPMGQRALRGILFGLASLWSARGLAWGFALLSLLTGSWTGVVIPMARLLPLNWKAPATIAGLLGAVCVLVPHLGVRAASRWAIWSSMGWWKDHWLSGWGFQQLPGGFQEIVMTRTGEVALPLRDLHSTWLDILAHGGLIGMVALLGVMAWAWQRSRATNTTWTWGFAAWVMTWQSVGSHPALILLALVWLASLVEPQRRPLSVHPL